MSEDVRKEQTVLLHFEKKLIALAAFVAAGSATAASAATKIDPNASLTAYDEIKQALVHLADVTTRVHASLEQSAMEAGARAWEVSGGIPKENPPAEVVRSLLGVG